MVFASKVKTKSETKRRVRNGNQGIVFGSGFRRRVEDFLGFFYESEFWKATERDIEERLKFGAIK